MRPQGSLREAGNPGTLTGRLRELAGGDYALRAAVAAVAVIAHARLNPPMPETCPAYVALGSNLNDPAAQIERAINALADLPESRLLRCSRLYVSPPMGPQDQPDYVNAVVQLETSLEPFALLDALQAIEAAQGRTRTGQRWGARTLDLDLLLLGDLMHDDPRLTLPHPGMHERDFVLYPLAEIAPQLKIPGLAPINELLAQCPVRGLRPLDRADD